MDEPGNCAQVNNEKAEAGVQGSQGDETKAFTRARNNSCKRSHTEEGDTVTLSKGNLYSVMYTLLVIGCDCILLMCISNICW